MLYAVLRRVVFGRCSFVSGNLACRVLSEEEALLGRGLGTPRDPDAIGADLSSGLDEHAPDCEVCEIRG